MRIKFNCFISLLFLFYMSVLEAQVKIGGNTQDLHPRSLLELESTTKGLLLPRMNIDQMLLMNDAPIGLMIFNISDNRVYIKTLTEWVKQPAVDDCPCVWSRLGLNIFNTNSGNIGIGINNPKAGLHINKNEGIIATGDTSSANTYILPHIGTAAVMYWHPKKSAFRAGFAMNSNNGVDNWDDPSVGEASAAFGMGTIASGKYSFASGYQSVASNFFSTAVGGSQSTGTGSFASGTAHAVNDFASALGSANATGFYSFANGFSTTASGSFATAFGQLISSAGTGSFASGMNNTVTGDLSVGIGGMLQVSGIAAVAFGNQNKASGNYSFVSGLKNSATGESSSAMGIFASTGLHTRSFVINGSSNATETYVTQNTADNQMMMNFNDYVFWTNTPGTMIEFLEGGINTTGKNNFKGTDFYSHYFFGLNEDTYLRGGKSSSYVVIGDLNAGTTIGTSSSSGATLTVGGNVCATSYNTCSDIRFKKNIQPLENVLLKISRLNGVQYDFRKEDFAEKKFSNRHQIGLIAQDVEMEFPEIVETDLQGYKSIDYSKLTPLLIESVKELKRDSDEKVKRIAELERQYKELSERLEKLERYQTGNKNK